MSIQDEIKSWWIEGDLVYLTPRYPTNQLQRHIFASRQVSELLDGPWDNQEQEQRALSLSADVDSFILGRLITARMEPYQRDTANIAILDPVSDGVWEIRAVNMNPQLRIFGAFALTDIFIALNWEERPYLGEPGSLGDPKGRRWRDAIQTCKQRWSHFFPTYNRLIGASIHDFISKNVVVV